MKAVIMAGGEGTRLRPLTSNAPKPMMPVVNRPMMEHIVKLLKEHGFDDIVVTLAFLPQTIRTYFGDGSEFGVRMVYATEESPLGTAGSVRNAKDELDEPFLVISGDVLTDFDLSEVVRFHEERKAMATIALKAMENPLEFGIVITRDDGSIDRFLEKPTWGQVFSDYCRIEAGANLRAYTVLGANVMVRSDAYIERTVVHDNAYISQGVRLRGSVIGRSSDLRLGARCEEGVVLGDDCFVGEHAVINPGVKIYPFKTVEPGAIVNSSIIWESRGARSLFGREGIAGLANVDVTPELAVEVAMAYATTLKKGSTVTISRDSSRAARALKRAMMAGLNAAGVNVDDLDVAPVPVTRFQLRSERAQGGTTVRLVPDDPQSVVLRFFDADGTDIDEGTQRKIERYYHRQDFRRAFAADIGDIGFPPHAIEFYTAALMGTVDADAIRAAGHSVVIDYAYGSASFVMPNVLAKLGADVLSVNPYASTAGAAAFDVKAHANRVADLVRAASARLGVVI